MAPHLNSTSTTNTAIIVVLDVISYLIESSC